VQITQAALNYKEEIRSHMITASTNELTTTKQYCAVCAASASG